MFNIDFVIPFICLCLSFSWTACTKMACKRNYDDVVILDSPVWSYTQLLTILSIVIAIIIVLVKVGFLASLCYLGIALGCVFIGQFTTSVILVAIFGYQFLGAILPLLSCIGTAIWMFSQISSLS